MDRHFRPEAPIVLADVELSGPLTGIPRPAGPARSARVLVRLHSLPVGIVALDLPPTGLEPSSLRAAIWEQLSARIRERLAADGSALVDRIPAEGFGTAGQAACSWRAYVATSNPPRATVVINTCGARAQLAETVTSALGQDYPNFDVMVVDNRPSTSGVRGLLEETFSGVSGPGYTPELRPGLGRARNAGLRATTAEVVAFTDDDVVLDRSWLSWLVAGFGVADDVACVTGLILPLELETPAQVLFDEFNGWSSRLELRVWDRNDHRLDHPLYPYTVGLFGSGASAAFRRRVLEDLGGFDPHLGIGTRACGGEDLDVYSRLVLGGHRLVYQPAAMLRHAHPKDMKRLQRQTRLYGVGLAAMVTKHLVEDSRTRHEVLRRIPAGVTYTFSPRSAKNARKPRGYPFRFTLFELAGMAWGPIAYMQSRFSAAPRVRLTETTADGNRSGPDGSGAHRLYELMKRDLKSLDLLAVFISGIEIARQPIVIAVGVDRHGRQVPLGVYEGTTSNPTVSAALVADLVERGAKPDVRRLFVTDGGSAIGPAVRAAYGPGSPIQRCRTRERRKILGHLPGSERARVSRRLESAWRESDARRARSELKAISGDLEAGDLGGARAVLEHEEESLTVNRLGLSGRLRSSLSSTTAVNRPLLWAASSSTSPPAHASVKGWVAAALLDGEPKAPRIRGGDDLHLLARALHRNEGPKPAQHAAIGDRAAAAAAAVPGSGGGVTVPTLVVDLAALSATIALTATVAVGVQGVPRILLGLTFLTLVPGWAIVGRFTPVDGGRRLLLAVPVSLSVCALAATITLWLRAWQPEALLGALAFGSVVLIGWRLAATLRPLMPSLLRASCTAAGRRFSSPDSNTGDIEASGAGRGGVG
jgi:GT2 family glycosyltransferase